MRASGRPRPLLGGGWRGLAGKQRERGARRAPAGRRPFPAAYTTRFGKSACAFCHSIFASAAALTPEARSPLAVSSGDAAGKSEPNRILSGGISAVSDGSEYW